MTTTTFDIMWKQPTTTKPILTPKHITPSSLRQPTIPVRQRQPFKGYYRRPKAFELRWAKATKEMPTLTHKYTKPTSLNKPVYEVKQQHHIFTKS